MSCETQCRTQLLKLLAGICRVTTKLRKANLTGLKKAVNCDWVNSLLWREKRTLHRTRTHPKSLFTLRDRQALILLLRSSNIHRHNAAPALRRLTAVCAPKAKLISRKSPVTPKCISISLREVSKGGVNHGNHFQYSTKPIFRRISKHICKKWPTNT